jgi:hypothetical protein
MDNYDQKLLDRVTGGTKIKLGAKSLNSLEIGE